MASDDGLIITVLGAGASVGCGYPQAKDLFPQIREFGISLGDSCTKLKNAIDHVVKEAERLQCETPDDLALLTHQQRGDFNAQQQSYLTLSYARIATDAFFLSLEQQVTPTHLKPYKDYWHEVFGFYRDNIGKNLSTTSHRLFTFNYDRLPEKALIHWYPQLTSNGRNNEIHGTTMLNSGLTSFDNQGVADDWFCYLKLHGTIGAFPITSNQMGYNFGDRVKHHSSLFNTNVDICDTLYFKESKDENPLTKIKIHPLIVFPCDKQRIESGGQDLYLADYIKTIKESVEKVFRRAKEIRVIGYSFQAPDKQWLLDLIRLAPNAKLKLLNPDATNIAQSIRFNDDLNFTPFDSKWV